MNTHLKAMPSKGRCRARAPVCSSEGLPRLPLGPCSLTALLSRDGCQGAAGVAAEAVSDGPISFPPRSIMRPQPVKNHSPSKVLSPATYH